MMTVSELIERLQQEPEETEVEFFVFTKDGKVITLSLSHKFAKDAMRLLKTMAK